MSTDVNTTIERAVYVAFDDIKDAVEAEAKRCVDSEHDMYADELHVAAGDMRLFDITMEDMENIAPHFLASFVDGTIQYAIDSTKDEICNDWGEDPEDNSVVGVMHSAVREAVETCTDAGESLTPNLLFEVVCGVLAKMEARSEARAGLVWSDTPEQNAQWSDVLMRYTLGATVLESVYAVDSLREELESVFSQYVVDVVFDMEDTLHDIFVYGR